MKVGDRVAWITDDSQMKFGIVQNVDPDSTRVRIIGDDGKIRMPAESRVAVVPKDFGEPLKCDNQVQ